MWLAEGLFISCIRMSLLILPVFRCLIILRLILILTIGLLALWLILLLRASLARIYVLRWRLRILSLVRYGSLCICSLFLRGLLFMGMAQARLYLTKGCACHRVLRSQMMIF